MTTLDWNLWFLQTQLTRKERLRLNDLPCFWTLVTHYVPKILHDVGFAEKRREELLSLYQGWQQKMSAQIVGHHVLAQVRGRPLSSVTPLAFDYRGNVQILRAPTVGIVGSRKPTYYGREQAYIFAKTLAQAGCTIISGGAIGIDAIANSVALEHGASCAIIGNGLGNPYPASNRWMFERLMRGTRGLIMSEFPFHEGARKWNFLQRNESLASLCDFLLVVEATQLSGSLVTAKAAAQLGVEVGALPGGVDNINSEGTNLLIQNGAHCIRSPQDILDCLQRIRIGSFRH